jgi:hypothetical protein
MTVKPQVMTVVTVMTVLRAKTRMVGAVMVTGRHGTSRMVSRPPSVQDRQLSQMGQTMILIAMITGHPPSLPGGQPPSSRHSPLFEHPQNTRRKIVIL